MTNPLTSLRCLAPVLRCMFCGKTKHVLLSVLRRRSDCARSFAGHCRQIFSLVFSVGSLASFFFVTRATLSMYLKALKLPSMQLLLSCHAMVWNPSLARGSYCSRRVSGALAKCLMRWEQSCGQSTCEVSEALRGQSQFVVQKC